MEGLIPAIAPLADTLGNAALIALTKRWLSWKACRRRSWTRENAQALRVATSYRAAFDGRRGVQFALRPKRACCQASGTMPRAPSKQARCRGISGTDEGGAGEGNRTLVVSLGSFCSAIELHPRSFCRVYAVSTKWQEASAASVDNG